MNVQRVERIADFVRDAGGEQRERLHAFALNGFKSFLPRLGCVVQNGARRRNCRRLRRQAARRRAAKNVDVDNALQNSWRVMRSPPVSSARESFPNPPRAAKL